MPFTRLSLPQFGGDGITVLANDNGVAVDGTSNVSVRVPISTRHATFTNAACDKSDKQLVLEVTGSRTDALSLRLAVKPRVLISEKTENLFVLPDLTESVQLVVEIINGELIIKAHRPIDGVSDNRCYTMLRVPLANVISPAK